MTASEDFTSVTDPFRAELLGICYRMLGSADEAEDVVQETYLRAWRSYQGFQGRSSVRTWLCRIVTNTCLTARQRAVLILRDVLEWPAAQLASLLGLAGDVPAGAAPAGHRGSEG